MKNDYQRYAGMTAEEMEASLLTELEQALHARYGEVPDPAIRKRFEEECGAVERTGTILNVAALYELTHRLKGERKFWWIRGCGGSSFLFWLLGITAVNPLPPHYWCPTCRRVIWQADCADGFDLPQGVCCEHDGTLLLPDGHAIPWQTLWGYGEHCPSFDIEVADDDEVSPVPVDAGWRDLALDEWECFIDPDADVDLPVPQSFADLAAVIGLSRTAWAWDEDALLLTERFGYFPSDLIVHREDVYRYLLDHGFLEKDAWRGMEAMRKGKGLPVVTEEMRTARDKWVLSRCSRIQYLFPKAHTLEFLFFELRRLNHVNGWGRMMPSEVQQRRILTGMETMEITRQGCYFKGERCIPLGKEQFWNPDKVVVYAPKTLEQLRSGILEKDARSRAERRIQVVDRDSLAAAAGLDRPLVLNFANARTPGGGFLYGSPAQEESLCRGSTLYASLASDKAREMYDYNKVNPSPVDSAYLLLSPEVWVIRGGDGELLDRPYPVSVITMPAPDKVRRAHVLSQNELDGVMKERIRNLAAVAVHHGCRSLVLGAWGCGVFGNDPADVARCFHHVLIGEGWGSWFDNIVFAILRDRTKLEIFARQFGM